MPARRPGAPPRRSRGLALFLVCLLILLAVAEVAARFHADFIIMPHKGIVLRREDAEVERMVRRYQIDGVDMWQYQGDRPAPKSPASAGFRIVGIGDSIMAPFKLPWQKGFFNLLVEKLRQHDPGAGYDGVNLSEGGFNLLQDKLMLRSKGLGLKPRLVVLQMWQDDNIEYKFIGRDLYTLKYYKAMQERMESRGIIPRLLHRSYLYTRYELKRLGRERGRPTISVTRQLQQIYQECSKAGIGLVILLFPTLDRPFKEQQEPESYAEVKKVADAHHIPYLEMRELLLKEDFRKLRMDNVHLNEQGHRLVAERLYKELRGSPLVRPKRQLSRHELCAAVARGDPEGCRRMPHHPGRTGDCLLQISLKLAARGQARACELNLTPMSRQMCEMFSTNKIDCRKLRSLSKGFDSSRQQFEKADTFIKVCQLLDPRRITRCGPVDGRPRRRTLECQIALAIWAYLKRDPVVCRSLEDRRSRENCLAMLGDDVSVCTRWIDYEQPVDKPWWSRESMAR